MLDPEEYVHSMEDFIDWYDSVLNLVEELSKNFPDERQKYTLMKRVNVTKAILFILLTDTNSSYCPREAPSVRLYPRAYSLIAQMQMLFLNLTINLFSASSETFSDDNIGTPLQQ